jgi:hypothetical protein
MNKNISNLVCILFVAIVVTAPGCLQPDRENAGQLQNESRSVPLGDARSVDASIEMGVGKLSVSGGANDLMDGNFIYNLASWRPEIGYVIGNGVGNLTIRQPKSSTVPEGNARYEWDLRLKNEVPMNLGITLGAGTGDIRLGNLSLNRLRVNTGAGNMTVDLAGNWKRSLDVDIGSGVGALDIRLPSNVGVIAEVRHGVGDVQADSPLRREGTAYLNDAYGKSDVTMRVRIESGVGNIRLRLA